VAEQPRRQPEPLCPIRPGDKCTLCQVSVTGPQDCGLVYLVMGDEELRAGLRQAAAIR
jgi:hypothetical protein